MTQATRRFPDEMSAREKFLFDLNGYLVVPAVVETHEIDQLHRAIDAHSDTHAYSTLGTGQENSASLTGSRRRMGMRIDPLRLPAESAQPFRRLIAHPKVRRLLDTLVGRGWRLDSAPEVIMSDKGADGLFMHGAGSRWFSPAAYYVCKNDVIRCGLVNVEFVLTDEGASDGGFACIPGSHKSNFGCPVPIRKWESDQDLIRKVPMNRGDILLFSEALLHGSLPWTADHQRRVVIYRYVHKALAVAPPAAQYHEQVQPSWVEDLPEAERLALQGPYLSERRVLRDDGNVEGATEWY